LKVDGDVVGDPGPCAIDTIDSRTNRQVFYCLLCG